MIDISQNSIVFEIIGSSKTTDEIVTEFAKIGIDSMSRTGVVAGFKGNKKLTD